MRTQYVYVGMGFVDEGGDPVHISKTKEVPIQHDSQFRSFRLALPGLTRTTLDTVRSNQAGHENLRVPRAGAETVR